MKALAGTWSLVRLILRRDRIILPLWVAVLALLPVAIANTLADLYPTAAERQSYLDIVTANPALSALYGHAYGSGLGALTAWRLGGTVLLVGLATLLTVIRHTRAEEVAGRRELLGATVVGRQAPLFAALVVAFGASLALGALVSVGLVAYGLPTTGSVAFGLSWTMFGWAFAAVAAVAAQVTESARVARGISIAVLALRPRAKATGRRRLSGAASVAGADRRCPRRGRAPGLPETRCPLIHPRQGCHRYRRNLVPSTRGLKKSGEPEEDMMRKAEALL